MTHLHHFLIAALIVPGVASTASAVDMTQLTCEGLLAAGHDNVATMLTWLQGYHAGKNGRVSTLNKEDAGAYGTKFGLYCKEHPNSSALDASEHALASFGGSAK